MAALRQQIDRTPIRPEQPGAVSGPEGRVESPAGRSGPTTHEPDPVLPKPVPLPGHIVPLPNRRPVPTRLSESRDLLWEVVLQAAIAVDVHGGAVQ